MRYGKYNSVFPYRTFSKNSVCNSVSYFLSKSNRTVIPYRGNPLRPSEQTRVENSFEKSCFHIRFEEIFYHNSFEL